MPTKGNNKTLYYACHNVTVKVLEQVKYKGWIIDGIKLSECSWDSPTYATTPTCTIAWIPDSSSDHYRVNEAIKLPLYNTNLRDKILTFVQVPSGGEEHKWLQAGTVLFLDDQL